MKVDRKTYFKARRYIQKNKQKIILFLAHTTKKNKMDFTYGGKDVLNSNKATEEATKFTTTLKKILGSKEEAIQIVTKMFGHKSAWFLGKFVET